MKIIMVVRKNFYELGGGDRIQVLKTKEALEKRGHTITIVTSYPRNLDSCDILHLFNMMLAPHAYLLYTLYMHAARKPVALSTIYWNPGEWLAHAEDEGFPVAIKAGERNNRFDGIPLWRVIWGLIRFTRMRRWLWLSVRYRNSGLASTYIRKTLVSEVDIILPNGQSEAESVQNDFAKAKQVAVIPNGVDDAFASARPDNFIKRYGKKDFVLHVGRIETRKNLIALVQAVNSLGLALVVIGNDTHDPTYTAAVKAAAPIDTLFIPELPHDQLGAAYKAAKVHALASWFETPGLSSLEAGLAGCNIVSTDRGTTKEYFQDMAWYCDPSDRKSIKQAISEAYAAPKSTKLRERILAHYTWNTVAEATEAAYKRIISGELV